MILIHSAMWALAYGKHAEAMRMSLAGGINMAATRFRLGDTFCVTDVEETSGFPDKNEGVVFSRQIKDMLGDNVICLPCKDLRNVKNPTVVGLGDSFAGGLLPGLLVENRITSV